MRTMFLLLWIPEGAPVIRFFPFEYSEHCFKPSPAMHEGIWSPRLQ